MEKLGLNVLREKYLSFFESKGHLRLPSFSLVPKNDASLLLINSGMAPLKPYFTGASVPPCKRITTCQKCIRTPDIDNVGKTARHGTFFEMLGNFSFGDYFKNEATAWAWEFFTVELKIPQELLYITIYQDDDEAFDIWTKKVGVPADRIIRLGKEDNFWEHGTGPCGPCSEIHFDRGEKYGCGKPGCIVGCDCDRYIEVWNLVFTQFDKKADGTYEKLSNPNIDTGMGLERLACVMQGVDNLFEVDTVRHILDKVCEIANVKYGINTTSDVSIRVITDHIRSTVMMISDGVIPSNEGRGYVLRRLLRRAARHGRHLGIEKAFLCDIVQTVIDASGEAYPNLIENRVYIKKIISVEEERFASTIGQGMLLLQNIIDEHKEDKKTIISGSIAFKLHDTYGFPLDLTKEILSENGLGLDEDGFKKEMKAQKDKAREAIKNRDSSWGSGEVSIPSACPKTKFLGYETLECDSNILYLIKSTNDEQNNNTFTEVDAVGDDENVIVITDVSTFYGESGGQAGDSGYISTNLGKMRVFQTGKKDGKWFHVGIMETGTFTKGDVCHMEVDRTLRLATERNHSATHILQKALQKVLGDHVHQSGSNVTPERLRFDFNHTQSVSKEELELVETEVNRAIYEDYDVVTQELPIEEARKFGAMALFGEKYGEIVRVVSMGNYSVEFCGGTHVKHSSAIGMAKIISEGAVAAGTRRIEMITGSNVRAFYMEKEEILKDISVTVKANVSEVNAKVLNLSNQYKAVVKELDELKLSISGDASKVAVSNAIDVKGVKVITSRFDMLDGDALRDMAEKLRSSLEVGVVVVASGANDKVSIVAMATKEAVSKGIKCGTIASQAAAMCGGGGGGRPDMAQAGGKDVSAIDNMLASMPKVVESLIKL